MGCSSLDSQMDILSLAYSNFWQPSRHIVMKKYIYCGKYSEPRLTHVNLYTNNFLRPAFHSRVPTCLIKWPCSKWTGGLQNQFINGESNWRLKREGESLLLHFTKRIEKDANLQRRRLGSQASFWKILYTAKRRTRSCFHVSQSVCLCVLKKSRQA